MQTALEGLTTRPKKICWLENGEIFGGAEAFGIEILGELKKSTQEETHVHYLHNGNHPEILKNISALQKTLPEYITLTAETFPLPQLSKPSLTTLQNFFTAVWNLRKKIQNEKYDIIYTNTVRTGILFKCADFLLIQKQKSIFFAHDYTFPKKIIPFFLPRFSKVFTCSYPVKTFLSNQGIANNKTIAIENGVDTKKFIPTTQKEKKQIIIGNIGRITPWKGQLTIIKAARRMQDLFPEKNIAFSFFGEAGEKPEDQEFYQRLQHFVRQYSLEKTVRFEGYLPAEKALKKVDILIHASEEAEPFGRTPLEGAATDTPLILSNLGTPSQIFTHQKDALMFEPGDKKDLCEKIQETIDNPENTKERVENAKKLIEEKFSLDRIGKRFWREFFAVLNG